MSKEYQTGCAAFTLIISFIILTLLFGITDDVAGSITAISIWELLKYIKESEHEN